MNFVQFVENSCTVQYTPEERHVKTGKLKSACRFQRFLRTCADRYAILKTGYYYDDREERRDSI